MHRHQPTRPGEIVERACQRAELVGHDLRDYLKREVLAKVLLRQARDVVLLTGSTGTGKERISQVCHESARDFLGRRGELVEVNCANMTGGLFESELFGYRRGAFTSADRDHPGLARQATGGTLVLDEVQALEPRDQARLLRFLGEREYRAVGDDRLQSSDALIILCSNQDLSERVQRGSFRRDLLDRATAKIDVPPLFKRRRDIGALAQAFALEAGRDMGADEAFYGLTRRAQADVEAAVLTAQEVSVRRLREVVRDCVFCAAADRLPEQIESDMVVPVLSRDLGFAPCDRDTIDRAEVEAEFDVEVASHMVNDVAERHNVSPKALGRLVQALQTLMDEMEDTPRTYRNVVERTNRLSKVALWLLSGAKTQAEFRRFFGQLDGHMPTKSVAHQIYHDVFRRGGHA